MPDGILPHELLTAGVGAGGLATLYLVMRMVATLVKGYGDARLNVGQVNAAEAETRKADAQMRLAVEQAQEAGVGMLADMVKAMRDQLRDQAATIADQGIQISALEARGRRFRGIVIRFIDEVTVIVPEMQIEVRSRVQDAIDRFRREDDGP